MHVYSLDSVLTGGITISDPVLKQITRPPIIPSIVEQHLDTRGIKLRAEDDESVEVLCSHAHYDGNNPDDVAAHDIIETQLDSSHSDLRIFQVEINHQTIILRLVDTEPLQESRIRLRRLPIIVLTVDCRKPQPFILSIAVPGSKTTHIVTYDTDTRHLTIDSGKEDSKDHELVEFLDDPHGPALSHNRYRVRITRFFDDY